MTQFEDMNAETAETSGGFLWKIATFVLRAQKRTAEIRAMFMFQKNPTRRRRDER